MTTRTHSDERKWANTDPAMHCNGTERMPRVSWHGAWIWCLRYNDEESAHLIRLRNDERYAERCAEDAASAFPAKGSELKSLTEITSEQRESEAA